MHYQNTFTGKATPESSSAVSKRKQRFLSKKRPAKKGGFATTIDYKPSSPSGQSFHGKTASTGKKTRKKDLKSR